MSKRILSAAGAALISASVLALGAPAAQAEEPPTGRELLDKCDNGTDVCVFHPKGPPELFVGDTHQVGDTSFNCTQDLQRSTIKWSETTGESNSFGVSLSAEAGFAGVYKVAIETSYEHTWTTEAMFGQDENVDVRPGEKGWVERGTEMFRTNGTYEMHFPDKFHDHYIWYQDFEAVGPKADAAGTITKKTAPMTEEEKAAHCG